MNRRFSIDYDQSPTATQSKDLPGHQYETAAKRQRLCAETTPSVHKTVPKCTLSSIKKPISPLALDVNNITINNTITKMGTSSSIPNESTTEPSVDVNILSTTILENTAFQSVLLNSLNNILQTPSKDAQTIENATTSDTGFQFDMNSMNLLLNSLERDPTYEELVEDCVQAVEMNKSGKTNQTSEPTTSTPHKSDSEHSSCSSIPIKRRLRKRKPTVDPLTIVVPDTPQRCDDKPRRKSTSKRANDIHVISNEPSDIGNQLLLQQVQQQPQLQPTYMAPNQLFIVNADGSLAMTDEQQPAFIINYVTVTDSTTDSPCILVSNAQAMNGCPALPGQSQSVVNVVDETPALENTDGLHQTTNESPASSSSNSDQKSSIAAPESVPIPADQPIEAPIPNTPKQLVTLNQSKAKSLSTPRRNSHVRVLNFCTPAVEAAKRCQQLLSAESHTDQNKSNMTPAYSIVDQNQPSSAPPKLNHRTPEDVISDHEEVAGQNESVDLFGRDLNEETVIAVHPNEPETNEQPTIVKVSSKPTPRKTHVPKSHSKKKIIRKQDEKKSIIEVKPQPKPKPRARKGKEPPPTVASEKVDQPQSSFGNDLDQWNKMRALKSDEWDNHLREEFSRCGIVGSTGRRDRRKRKQTPKQNKQASLNSSTDVPTADTSLNEEHAKQLAAALTTPAKVDEEQPPAATVDSHVESSPEEIVTKTPSRSNKIHIKLATPSKSVKKPKTSSCKIKYKEPKISPQPRSTIKRRSNKNEDCKDNQTNELEVESRVQKNLSTLLETPYKDDLGIPPTPRVLLPPMTHETPSTKLPRRSNADFSMIKNPDIPTPTFPITPGAGTTPLLPSSTHSRDEGLASDSPYYRPDESENIIPPSIRSRPTPIYDTASPIYEKSSQENPEMNDSSSSNSSTSSSSSSSSSNKSDSSTTSDAESETENTNIDVPSSSAGAAINYQEQRMLALKQQAKTLEEVRQRTMAKIKEGNSQERFKIQAPVTQRRGKLALRQGFSAAVAASKQKPTIREKSRVMPKKVLPKAAIKGKMATPKKTICLNSPISTSRLRTKEKVDSKATPNSESQAKTSEKQSLPLDGSKNHTRPTSTIPSTDPLRRPKQKPQNSKKDAISTELMPEKPCPPETSSTTVKTNYLQDSDFIDTPAKTTSRSDHQETSISQKPIELHKLPSLSKPCPPELSSYTSNAPTNNDKSDRLRNLFGDSDFIETPSKAIHENQLRRSSDNQGISHISDRIRDLFGDPSLSDSDFMDTPVKTYNIDQATRQIDSTDIPTQPKLPSPVKPTVDTPKKSGPIKLPAKKRRDATTDITSAPKLNDIDATTKPQIPPETITSQSKEEVKPPEAAHQLPLPILATPQKTPTEVSQPIAVIHSDHEQDDDSSSECDPYDECSLVFTSTKLPHCGIFNVISDSKTNPLVKPCGQITCTPFNLVIDGERVRLSTTEELVLFSQEPTQMPSKVKEHSADSNTKTPKAKLHPSKSAVTKNTKSTDENRTSDEFGAPLLSSTPLLKKPIPKMKITYKPDNLTKINERIDW